MKYNKPYLEKLEDPEYMRYRYVLNIPDLYLVKVKNKMWIMWWLLRLGWFAIREK